MGGVGAGPRGRRMECKKESRSRFLAWGTCEWEWARRQVVRLIGWSRRRLRGAGGEVGVLKVELGRWGSKTYSGLAILHLMPKSMNSRKTS